MRADTLPAAGAEADFAPAADLPRLDGASLKARREAAGLSQRALAKRAAVPQSTISNLESGLQAGADPASLAALDAVLDGRPPPPPPAADILDNPHNRIRPSSLNPRRHFDADALEGLAESIDLNGVLENLVVRPDPERAGDFLLIAGERRWRAMGLLIARGRRPEDTPLPARLRAADEGEHRALAIIENLQREDVSPLDEASAFQALIETSGWSSKRIAEAISKTERHVQLRLALLTRLHADAQAALAEGRVSLAIARALTLAPLATHPQLLEALADPDDWGIHTAEDLAVYIRQGIRPATSAIFDLNAYTGERVTDPETGEIWLLDGDHFANLQNAAIEALEAELRQRHDWVQRIPNSAFEPTPAWGFVDPDEAPADAPIGAVIRIGRELQVTVFERVIRRAAPRPDPAPALAPAAASPPPSPTEATPDPVDAVSHERRVLALQAKTRALQEALLATPGAALIQLALALMGCRQIADIIVPPPMPQNAVVAPSIVAALISFHEELGGDSIFLPLSGDWPYLSLKPCMRLTHRSSALLKALNDSRERVAASPLRHGPRS